MSLRKAKTFTFRPKGLSDAVDATNAFPGAMSVLSNIIPANDTSDMWAPRPAAVELSTFAGFTTPGFVSASLVVGNIEYGMIASGLNVGHDQPYAYNLLSGTFLTVGGITAGNTPASPASAGAWTPPIMAVVGNRVIVCHPGFPGGAVKFGWFDISSFTTTQSCTLNSTTTITSASNLLQDGVQPGQTVTGTDIPAGATVVSIASDGLSAVLSAAATGSTTTNLTFAGGTTAAPLWGAGDTNINNLPSVPVSVAQFNGRAYFACGVNGVAYSDSLFPCNRTNASQALTPNNGLAVTALGALPLSSPITGGIVQAIIAFQGVSALQQITGDPATNNLSMNSMNVATGTLAPLSICPTNFGLAFVSPRGLRVITFAGVVTDPIGASGQGVAVPFIYAAQPSRICAAAASDVLRISVQNASAPNSPSQEYWFDITRKIWSGPHTFPASLVQPWQNTFVVHPVGLPATIFQSDVVQTESSTFTENGTALSWQMTTCLVPDSGSACENNLSESTVTAALPGGYNLTIGAYDEQMQELNVCSIQIAGSSTDWGSFNWGAAPWSGTVNKAQQYPVPWTEPVVYKQLYLSLQGASVFGVEIGDSFYRYQELGYLTQVFYQPPPPTRDAATFDQSTWDGPDVFS